MFTGIHPGVQVIKNEIGYLKISYPELSKATHIPVNRLKNILSGRVALTLDERDALCEALNISPLDVLLRREDLRKKNELLDLRELPHSARNGLLIIYNEIKQLSKAKCL